MRPMAQGIFAYSELVLDDQPSNKDAYTVRNEHYKLVIHPNNDNEKLYHLVDDPNETINLLNRNMSTTDNEAYQALKAEANRIRNKNEV